MNSCSILTLYNPVCSYYQAIRALEEYHLQNAEQEKHQQSWLKTLYQNVAQCLLQETRSQAARMYADKALYMDPNSEKAHYIVGKVMFNLAAYRAILNLRQRFDKICMYLDI